MTKILLIRHGQSRANLENLFAGHSDFELTELGLQQAAVTADYIAENYEVTAVYASDLKRAFATGKATADRLGLPIVPCQGLREIFAGKWEGVLFETIPTLYPAAWHNWKNNFAKVVCPDGESVLQLQQRVLSAVREIARKHPDQTVVAATHATPVRLLMASCVDENLAGVDAIQWVSNASVTELIVDGERISLGRADISAHLKELKTGFKKEIV